MNFNKYDENQQSIFKKLDVISSIVPPLSILIMIIIMIIGCGGNGLNDNNTSDNNISDNNISEPIQIISDPVQIISDPVRDAIVNEKYIYNIMINKKSDVNVTAPQWLIYEKKNMVLRGTPQIDDVGINKIIVIAKDDENNSDIQEFNINVRKTYVELNNKLVFLPSYNIGYKAVKVPVEFIISDYDNISKYTIVFTRSIDGVPMDYEFATALIDVTHGVAIIKADVMIPENETVDTINHTISAIYLKDGIEELIYAVNIKQSSFEPAVVTHEINVDMTNANGGYTLATDENGTVHITPNVSFMKKSCEAQGWIWQQYALVCVPTPDEPEYQDVLNCINNPVVPNKWSFDLHACYAELEPSIDVQVMCGLLGLDYNTTNTSCY